MFKKIMMTTGILTALISSANAQFMPNSSVYEYTTEISKIDSISIDDRKHTIELNPSISQPHIIALIQWCNGVAARSNIPAIRDRGGLSRLAIGARSLSGHPADTKCYLTVPMNMGDSEFVVTLNDGVQTSALEFRYRDIDPINSLRISGQSQSPLSTTINLDYNEIAHFRFGKAYGNLALDGEIPDGLEVTQDHGGVTIAGRPKQSGAFTFTIHDLNSDNKSVSHTLTVAALAPEPEVPVVVDPGTTPGAGGNKQIVFRYPVGSAR